MRSIPIGTFRVSPTLAHPTEPAAFSFASFVRAIVRRPFFLAVVRVPALPGIAPIVIIVPAFLARSFFTFPFGTS